MNARILLLPLFFTALAGCAPMPLSPADVAARKFETVPDKAVIYLVRDNPDHNGVPATLVLGENRMVTTYPGTYHRWEVEPGRRQITGYGVDNGEIALNVEAGKLYFVQQWTAPWLTYAMSGFDRIPEAKGKAIVARSIMVGGQ